MFDALGGGRYLTCNAPMDLAAVVRHTPTRCAVCRSGALEYQPAAWLTERTIYVQINCLSCGSIYELVWWLRHPISSTCVFVSLGDPPIIGFNDDGRPMQLVVGCDRCRRALHPMVTRLHVNMTGRSVCKCGRTFDYPLRLYDGRYLRVRHPAEALLIRRRASTLGGLLSLPARGV